MTPFLGLRTFIVRVPDLDAAKAWYTEAFGTPPYFDEPFYVGYNIAGYELGLQGFEEGQEPATASNIETYWGVNDVQAAYDRFIGLGATPHGAPQNVGGPIIVATVKDPWGNVIGFIYNPEFGIEEVRH